MNENNLLPMEKRAQSYIDGYQLEISNDAVEKAEKYAGTEEDHVFLRAPTSCGKTDISITIGERLNFNAKQRGDERTVNIILAGQLGLVHQHQQTINRLAEQGLINKDEWIAETWQTYSNRLEQGRAHEIHPDFGTNAPATIFFDECHVGGSGDNIISIQTIKKLSGARNTVNVSATPQGVNQFVMGKLVQERIAGMSYYEAAEREITAPVEISRFDIGLEPTFRFLKNAADLGEIPGTSVKLFGRSSEDVAEQFIKQVLKGAVKLSKAEREAIYLNRTKALIDLHLNSEEGNEKVLIYAHNVDIAEKSRQYYIRQWNKRFNSGQPLYNDVCMSVNYKSFAKRAQEGNIIDNLDVIENFKNPEHSTKAIVAVQNMREGFDMPNLYDILDANFNPQDTALMLQKIGRLLRWPRDEFNNIIRHGKKKKYMIATDFMMVLESPELMKDFQYMLAQGLRDEALSELDMNLSDLYSLGVVSGVNQHSLNERGETAKIDREYRRFTHSIKRGDIFATETRNIRDTGRLGEIKEQGVVRFKNLKDFVQKEGREPSDSSTNMNELKLASWIKEIDNNARRGGNTLAIYQEYNSQIHDLFVKEGIRDINSVDMHKAKLFAEYTYLNNKPPSNKSRDPESRHLHNFYESIIKAVNKHEINEEEKSFLRSVQKVMDDSIRNFAPKDLSPALKLGLLVEYVNETGEAPFVAKNPPKHVKALNEFVEQNRKAYNRADIENPTNSDKKAIKNWTQIQRVMAVLPNDPLLDLDMQQNYIESSILTKKPAEGLASAKNLATWYAGLKQQVSEGDDVAISQQSVIQRAIREGRRDIQNSKQEYLRFIKDTGRLPSSDANSIAERNLFEFSSMMREKITTAPTNEAKIACQTFMEQTDKIATNTARPSIAEYKTFVETAGHLPRKKSGTHYESQLADARKYFEKKIEEKNNSYYRAELKKCDKACYPTDPSSNLATPVITDSDAIFRFALYNGRLPEKGHNPKEDFLAVTRIKIDHIARSKEPGATSAQEILEGWQLAVNSHKPVKSTKRTPVEKLTEMAPVTVEPRQIEENVR